MANRKGIPAAAFMANYSSVGRKIACVRCKQPARWDSIYCSEACRQEFLTFDKKPTKYTTVERWNGTRWIETRLEWDGTAYKEIK